MSAMFPGGKMIPSAASSPPTPPCAQGSPDSAFFRSPCDEFDIAPSASMKEHVRDGHMFTSEGSDAVEYGERFGKTLSFTRTFDWFEPGSPVSKHLRARGQRRADNGDRDAAFVDPGSPKQVLTDGEASGGVSDHSTVVGSIEIQSDCDKGKGAITQSCSTRYTSTSPTSATTGTEQFVSPTSYLACDPSQFSSSTMGVQPISLMMMLPPQGVPPLPPHGMPQGMPLPPQGLPPQLAQGGYPTAAPANPPGAWTPGEQQRAVAPPPEAAQIRLVRAARAPPPLNHNKGHPVTSLTINHLPFQMRQGQLCALLDETGFASRYNYVYVPCNHDKTNRGHAFVNFCSPQDAKDFFAGWHGARVVGAGSDSPVLSVAVSVVQGFEASIQKWTVAKMLRLKDPDFRPFIAGMPA